jgi:DNA primase catalytic subunit
MVSNNDQIANKKKLFEVYYSSESFLDNLILPPRANFHHFRFEIFSSDKIIYRKVKNVIRNKEEIQKILTRWIPKNVFYTPTQWLDPVNLRKGTDSAVSDVLLSCPLYFDIDSNSIKRSILLSKKLIDIIFKEYSKKPDQIIFSGRRGFHIYYWDWEDIDFNILNPAKRIEKFSQTRERIIKDLHSKNVEVDSTVTSDPWRILRLPGTLHGVTGLAAIPISNFDYTSMIKRAKVLPKEAYSGLKEIIET